MAIPSIWTFPCPPRPAGGSSIWPKRAHYFQGEIDSRKKNLASTGVKTLTYKDSARSATATYNYSPMAAVQQITQLFQSLSTTLEFGRRLEYFHRYQKLALDEELKRMDDAASRSDLEEMPAVVPILQRIVTDTSVINPVRARAQRMIERAGFPEAMIGWFPRFPVPIVDLLTTKGPEKVF